MLVELLVPLIKVTIILLTFFLTFCFAVMEDLQFTHSRHVVMASGLYLEWNTTSYEGVNFCLIL